MGICERHERQDELVCDSHSDKEKKAYSNKLHIDLKGSTTEAIIIWHHRLTAKTNQPKNI